METHEHRGENANSEKLETKEKERGLTIGRAVQIGGAIALAAIIGEYIMAPKDYQTPKDIDEESKRWVDEHKQIELPKAENTADVKEEDTPAANIQRVKERYQADDNFQSGYSANLRYLIDNSLKGHRFDEIDTYLGELGPTTRDIELMDLAARIAKTGNRPKAIGYVSQIKDPFIRGQAASTVSAVIIQRLK